MPVTSSIPKNALIGQIVGDFSSRFAPDGIVRYVADEDWARQNPEFIADLGLTPKTRRRMPDVLIYQPSIKRLVLVDASASQGVMTLTRRDELSKMYSGSRLELVFVTAFPSRALMSLSGEQIAWEDACLDSRRACSLDLFQRRQVSGAAIIEISRHDFTADKSSFHSEE